MQACLALSHLHSLLSSEQRQVVVTMQFVAAPKTTMAFLASSHLFSLSIRDQRTVLATMKFVVAQKATMACRVATLSSMAVRRFS